MQFTRLVIALSLLAASTSLGQPLSDPGWFNLKRGDDPILPDPSISPQELDSTAQPQAAPMGLSSADPGIAETITPEIQALARGLENDPVRIYNYVHDYITPVLYFGSKKGAQLTLLEKSGNDFDQCALLVSLLRSAGYSPQYRFGWMRIPFDATDGTHNDLHHWLCLNFTNTNWQSTSNYLSQLFYYDRGYPGYYFFAGDTNSMLFQRVWVALTVAGTNYYLDPGFKASEPIPGINLPTALGFASGATLSNALMTAAGGTVTANSVSGITEAGLRNALAGYTTNLLNYLQTNYPNADVREILSGWGRYPDYSTETALPKGLLFGTYGFPGTATTTISWDNEPTNLMSTLAISFAGTNYQWFMPQLQGQRLALTFDTNGTAQLWQDDALLAQNSTAGSSSSTNVVLAVNHPIGYWNWASNSLIDMPWNDVVVTNSYQRTNATYALSYAFEPDWGWLRQRQNLLDAYRQQGYPDTSRQVVSETLNP